MPDITSDIAFRITQDGGEAVRGSLEGINQSLNRSAGATSNLTRFVREQRTENRLQNFVFQESRGLITATTYGLGALTSATGNSSKAIQQLTGGLNQSFNAFQGANFAMAGLGIASGGTALAISALLATGIGLLAFLDDSKEKAKRAADEMQRYTEAAQQMAEGLDKTEAIKELAIIDKRIGAYKEETKAAQQAINLIQRSVGGKGVSETMEELGVFPALSKLKEEVAVNAKIIEQLDRRRVALINLIAAEEQAELVRKRKAATEKQELIPFLESQLAVEKQINNEILRRIQLDMQARRETPKPDQYGVKDELEWMLGPIKKERLLGKPVKLDTYYKDTHKVLTDVIRDSDRANVNQLRFISLLDTGIGTMQSALGFLNVSTDSFINKLLGALNIALSIVKVIEAMKFAGMLFGLGDISIPMGAITTLGPIMPLPKMTGGGGMTNITINAIDARSFQQMLNQPDNRRVFVNALSNAERLGIG